MTTRWIHVLWGAALLAGCLDTTTDTPTEDTATTTQSSIVQIGNIYQNGTLVSFDDVTNPIGGINLQHVVGLTACDATALYAVQQDSTTYSIWFSNDSGQSWTLKSYAGKSREIACDHAQLATLDANKVLWVSSLTSGGSLGAWSAPINAVRVDRIQGGDGTIYGTKVIAGGGTDVYTASAHSVGDALIWTAFPIAHIGASQVTGTGAISTGTDHLSVGNTLAWSRRAFALEPTGTVDSNASLLAGSNSWAGFNTGGERYTTLSAAAPNLLFGLETKSGVVHLGRIRVAETSCFDGIDNDGNGLTDAEDPACTQVVANSFCSSHSDGRYCANRYEPANFLDQPNQNASLTTCTNHVAAVTPGVCLDNPYASNADSLQSLDSLTPVEPANTGHYCNVHWPDGTWDFSWTGSKPCTTLLAEKPNGTIVRAGMYSTTGLNDVYVACSNGAWGPGGTTGAIPLQAAYQGVGHTANHCIFSVTAAALPLFDRMFAASSQILPPARSAGPYDHAPVAVDLAQFGQGQTGTSLGVDRFGRSIGDREPAYDLPLDEGRALYAVAGGVVIPSGSRVRDITGVNCSGTPNQGELYVKYSVGTDPTYRESFVVYYAHVRKRIVTPGQTVKPGQIIGYVGASGCTGGFAHLHAGVFRTSNTNAHTAAHPELGYRVNFQATTDSSGTNTGGWNSIDPLGWANGYSFDPWGYMVWSADEGYGFLGGGAWSTNLFIPGQQFSYP
ncbi:MAG: M23 family metallopeptidase [Kofleriaceae bacterium]